MNEMTFVWTVGYSTTGGRLTTPTRAASAGFRGPAGPGSVSATTPTALDGVLAGNGSTVYSVGLGNALQALRVNAAGDGLEFGGVGTWGSITGTLSDQTDLATALGGYLPLTGGTLTIGLITPTLSTGSLTATSVAALGGGVEAPYFQGTTAGGTWYAAAGSFGATGMVAVSTNGVERTDFIVVNSVVASVNVNGFSGPGANLTGLNANAITAGTLTDARLSSNVPLKDTANTFTALQTMDALTVATGGVFNQSVAISPQLTDYYPSELRLSNGNLCMRLRVRYDSVAQGSLVYYQFFNPRTGLIQGEFGFEDGFASLTVNTPLNVTGLVHANQGIRVGSFADTTLSGKITSYAGRGVWLEPQANKSTWISAPGVVAPYNLDSTTVLHLYGSAATTAHLSGFAPSASGDLRHQFRVVGGWQTPTDASRQSTLSLRVVGIASAIETIQTGIQITATASGVTALGFNGATPVAKPTFAANATDLATALTLVNDLKARLVAYGLGA